jgi:hypothetical protein
MLVRERLFGFGHESGTDIYANFQVDDFLNVLKISVSSYATQSDRSSKQIQDFISASLEQWGAETSFNFQPVREKSQANFTLDFMKEIHSSSARMFLGGELAFDNRQAIFTNVIKVDLALTRLREASEVSRTMSVLVTFCGDSRRLGNWDGSVATFEEYCQQLDWGLDRYLTGPLLLVGLSKQDGDLH